MSETLTSTTSVSGTAGGPAGPTGEPEGGCGCGGCGCGGGSGAGEEREAQGVTLETGVGASDLDVRGLPPEQRHALIAAAVGALVPGEAFVLANDHDPVRLRGRLEEWHPGQLTWSYLAEGPALWRVMIGREACC